MRETLQSTFLRPTLASLLCLALLLGSSLQACGEGCLACHEDVENGTTLCKVCDLFSSYIKAFDGSCEKKEIDNCEVASLNHFTSPCLQCEPNYVLDIIQGKCVSVNISKVVPDCFRYSSLSTCIACNPDHYISIGKCLKSETLVENCKFYSSDGVCSECLTDFFLDKDVNQCREYPNSTGCSQYNMLRCDQCQPGYAQDLNFYLRIFPTDSAIETLAVEQANSVQVSQAKDENCFPLNVPNCEVHETADKCMQCEDNYFVTEARQCQEYPQNRIDNCLIYSSETSCQECEFLYKLDSNKCERRVLKDHCIKYQINGDNCEQCESGYKVSGGNCVVRGTVQMHCKELEKDSDDCEICEDGYVKADDKSCFEGVANCKTHITAPGIGFKNCTTCEEDYIKENDTKCTLRTHQAHCKEPEPIQNLCKTCETGFYNKDGVCNPYTIDFCNDLNLNENLCADCVEGFKFKDGICSIVELNNCKKPSATNEGECEECVEGFYKDASSICRVRNLVGCEIPEAGKNECKTCADGYYLDFSLKLCHQKLIPHCNDERLEKCEDCDPGFAKNSYGTCSRDLKLLENCTGTTKNDGNVCLACDDSDTHFLEPISRKCLARQNRTECASYDSGADLCLSCSNGHYLEEGFCKAIDVQCQTTPTIANECTDCPANYYLDPITKTCLKNITDNCGSSAENFAFGCKTCDNGYYLNSSTKLCEKGNLPHCTTYEASDMICKTCAVGTFLSGGRCYKPFALGCRITKTGAAVTNDQVCTECLKGFFLKDGKCLIANIPKCKTFNTTNQTCTTCEEGYYPADNNLSCDKQFLLNCVKYKSNLNECAICDSLFFVDSSDSNKCKSITTSNCSLSAGIKDECNVCAPGYRLYTNQDETVSCELLLTPRYSPTKNCVGNGTEDDIVCSVCENNFELAYMTQSLVKLPDNCAKLSAANPFLCSQCIERFEFDTTNMGVCKPAASVTDCVQARPGFNVTLALASSKNLCEKCVDDSYHNNNGKCTENTQVLNCSEYSKIKDECAICKHPFSKQVAHTGQIKCETVSFALNNNCAVYDAANTSTTTCLLCKAGFKGTTCDTPTKYDFPEKFWDQTLDLSSVTITDNTSAFLGVKDAAFHLGAKDAISGKTLLHSNFKNFGIYDYVREKNDYGAFRYNTVSVFPDTTQNTSWSHNIIVAGCKFIRKSGNKYFCAGCEAGKVGIGKYDSVGTNHSLEKCEDATAFNLQSNFTGMGYFGHDLMTKATEFTYFNTGFGAVVNFDNCSNGLVPVAYLVEKGNFLYLSDFSQNKSSVMECVLHIFESNVVENCQVYGYVRDDRMAEPDVVFTENKFTKCLACKPGYEGSEYGTGSSIIMPGKCTRIANCDLSSADNTKMNSCGKCKDGYAWEYYQDSLNILFHKCIAAPDNCQVYNPTLKQCTLCHMNYLLDANRECKPKSEFNCDNIGFQNVDFLGLDVTTLADDVKMFGFVNTFYLAKELGGDSDTHFCQTCTGSGTVVNMQKASKPEKACGYVDISDSNCKEFKYVAAQSKKCAACEEGFILDVETHECFNSEFYNGMENCKETSTDFLAKNKCIICVDGTYYNSKTSLCNPDEHCIGTNNYNECNSCAEGYYLDFDSKMCTTIPESSECAKLQNFDSGIINSLCLECADPTLIPLNFKNEEIYSFTCIEDTLNDTSLYSTFLTAFSPTCMSQTLPFSVVNGDTLLATMLHSSNYVGSEKVCLSRKSVHHNCQNFDYITNKCVKCYDNFYLDSQGMCHLGAISNCKEYSDANTCKECISQHYLVPNTTPDLAEFRTFDCKAHTEVCETFQPGQDLCMTCPPNYFLSIDSATEYQCQPHDISGCAVYFPTENFCMICSPGYYTDTTAGCTRITVENCDVYSRQTDTCITCRDGFYLDLDQKCKAHTRLNCKIYAQFRDACLQCDDGFYLNEKEECLENILVGCDIPKPNQNKCSLCSTGYWLDIKKALCKPHTVLHCSLFNKLENKCLVCDDSSYMNSSGICVEYSTATGCKTFNSTEDKCNTCLEGHYLDTDKVCKVYSMTTCKTFNKTKDKCTSCYNSYYLDVANSFNCKEITAQNCVKFSVSENRCSLCSESDYLDLTSGSCTQYSVQNCEEYHPYKNHCSTCKSGHYIDTSFNCIEYSAPGCASYSFDSDACVSCALGFYLKATTLECLSYTAKHCVSYQLEADKCSSCLPGFYLNNGECKPYTVANCAKNDLISDRCIGCKPEHYFSGGNCVAYTVEHCKDFEEEKNMCTSCLPGYYFEFGRCFEYTAQHCATYNPEKDLCAECDNSSLRIFRNADNQFCEKVTEVEHCASYSTTQDLCLKCDLDYFLEDNACHPNPTGIPMCTVYLEETECGLCEPGAYLSNNSCKKPEQTITGCFRYSSEEKCEECQTNFALTSTFQCEQTAEDSCATYVDASNCASCEGNKVLAQNTLNNTVCQDSGISFCAEAVNSSGNVICNRCTQGYFLNDGQTKCLWPETLVEHCLEYSGHGICSRCKDNYLLSKDNSKCTTDIASVGSKCLVGHISDKPKCSRCEGGFYFDDSGICQKCYETIEGCQVCDISNLSRCLICAKGFYMTDGFECKEYPPVVVEPIGVEILRAALVGLLALALALK